MPVVLALDKTGGELRIRRAEAAWSLQVLFASCRRHRCMNTWLQLCMCLRVKLLQSREGTLSIV